MAYLPGDILLVRNHAPRGSNVLANLITAGERARYGDSDYARWTHAALIVSADGDLVEALAEGVRRTNISKYSGVEILVISPPSIPAGAPERAYAVRFALARVGDDYDGLDFAALAGSLLTGLDLSLHSDVRFICSGLVARATECYTESGYQYPSEQMTPADLGAYYHALSGEPLPPPTALGRALDRVRSLAWALSPFTKGLRGVD